MTGFKEGASGDDPLSGEEDDDELEERLDSGTESGSLGAHDVPGGQRSASPSDLPWIYARNGITDGREKTVQLHLQHQTIDGERELVAALEQRLNESVNKADAREAAYLVAMNHVDEVANQLREWGYDH